MIVPLMRSSFPLIAILVLALADCADKSNCDALRQSLYEAKKQWAACDLDSDCLVMAGNSRDCTGLLACPFGVNRGNREAAERATLTVGEDSVDCHLCATPNCAEGSVAICETLTHQCILVAESFEGGGGGGTTPGYDSGVTNPQPDVQPDMSQ